MHDTGRLEATIDKTCRASAPSRRRARLALHALFAVIGLVALGLLVGSAGARSLLITLRIAARWLPLLLALDVLRIGCEALGTFYLSRLVRRVPMATLLRIHLIGHAVGGVMPAGRSARLRKSTRRTSRRRSRTNASRCSTSAARTSGTRAAFRARCMSRSGTSPIG